MTIENYRLFFVKSFFEGSQDQDKIDANAKLTRSYVLPIAVRDWEECPLELFYAVIAPFLPKDNEYLSHSEQSERLKKYFGKEDNRKSNFDQKQIFQYCLDMCYGCKERAEWIFQKYQQRSSAHPESPPSVTDLHDKYFIQLARASLRYIKTDKIDCLSLCLAGVDFESAKFYEENFNYVDCSGANFTSATLGHVTVEGTKFSGANFNRATIFGVDFRLANIDNATFEHTSYFGEANFSEVDFSDKNLGGACFSHTTLVKTDFSDADLKKASFLEVDLRTVIFDDAILTETSFSQVNLGEVNFSGKNLGGAYFSNTAFVGADLSGANLDGASFGGADLRLINFQRATTTEANFCRTIFVGYEDFIPFCNGDAKDTLHALLRHYILEKGVGFFADESRIYVVKAFFASLRQENTLEDDIKFLLSIMHERGLPPPVGVLQKILTFALAYGYPYDHGKPKSLGSLWKEVKSHALNECCTPCCATTNK